MMVMHYLKVLTKYLTSKEYRWCINNSYGGFHKKMPDDEYLTKIFKNAMGKELDLKNPLTFNEKLQWLKLNDRKPVYTVMVDKYEAKNYVAKIIGDEFIIPTLGVWNRFDDIDFNTLPRQFVLKTTHDSGGVVVCKDKNRFNVKKCRKIINSSLKKNYFYQGREWPYKNVSRRIIAEKYMEDATGALMDYKFMCFNGHCEYIFTCTERFSESGLKVTFFDRNWNLLPFKRHYPISEKKITKPVQLEKMIFLAEKLSESIPFVRVDFYEIEGKIYFGELTFFPGSGIEEFTPEEWDYKLGELITLPKCNE